MGFIGRFKEFCSSVNVPLLKVKVLFFLTYSVWFATYPYISVMQTQIITYEQLAILNAVTPVVTIGGPIVTGFLGDKLGNYNILTIFGVVLGGVGPCGVLWLFNDHQHYKALQYNITDQNLTSDSSWQTMNQQEYTYPLLIFFRLVSLYSSCSTLNLVDAYALTICKKHGGDFGRQKLWGNASMGIIPLICGVLVDYISAYLGYQFDAMAFLVAVGFIFLVVPLILQLDMEIDRNKKSVINTIKEASGMIDFDIFLVVSIVSGMGLGFHTMFRPVFATELGGSNTLIGLMLFTSGFGTMILLSQIKIIIAKLGEANTVVIALILYCVRSVFFYHLENPWFLVISELLDGLCGFSVVVAGSYYCAAEAPPGMLASLNGIVTAAIFGAGRGIGTSIGSLLISKYGIRITYLFGGFLTGGTAIIYFIVYHLLLRKIRMKRHLLRDKEPQKVCGIDNAGVDVPENIDEK